MDIELCPQLQKHRRKLAATFCRNVFWTVASKCGLGTAALLIAVTSGYATADDTEIFFGRETAQPNILLILDTSGSMSTEDGTGFSRLDRIKEALTEIITTTTNANIGLMEFSGAGNHLWHAVQPITPEYAVDLLDTIDNLKLEWGTPTVRALLEGARYFSGAPLSDAARLRTWNSETHSYTCANENAVDETCHTAPTVFTDRRGLEFKFTDSAAHRVFDRDAYIVVEGADAFSTSHDHCTPDDLTHPSCGTEKIVGAASYKSPITSECQSNHIVLLTDGLPARLPQFPNATINSDVAAELKIASCNASGYVRGYPGAGKCATDISNYLSTTDLSSDVSGDNHVTTHTIGLEIDKPWLVSISAASTGGTHHQASSAQSLIEAFASIVAVSQKDLNTFVAPAITLDTLQRNSHREDIYLSLFTPSANAMWDGNLKRYNYANGTLTDVYNDEALDADSNFKDSAKSWWSDTTDGNNVTLGGAASKLGYDNRNVYTNISGNNLTADNNAMHESNGAISRWVLGTDSTVTRRLILRWVRGIDVRDYDDDLSNPRRTQMGDPLHSQPVLITYSITPETTEDPAIYNSVAFVGTNQGYLHAIDTETGEEIFSFIPKDLLPNLNTFYENERRLTKLYGLDGDITSWVYDSNNDGIIGTVGTVGTDDHAYLYVGMRRGGNNYYALDVTDTDNPEILWTIEGGASGDSDFLDLGQSWSKPTPASIMHEGVATKVLVFAGGYDSMQDNSSIRSADSIGNALFIVNATTGDLIWKANATNYPSMVYSIPADPALIDVNGDGLTDTISVGDMGGQVWRFDLNIDSTSSTDLVTGGVVAELATDADRHNRKFFDSPKLAVIEDTDRSNNLVIAIGSGNRAHPLEVSNDDRFYMIKQDGLNAPAGYGMAVKADGVTTTYRTIKEVDLYDATDNNIESSDPTTATDAATALAAAQGWRIKLTTSGEKATSTSTLVANALSFKTYIPAEVTDICAPSIGSSRLYKIRALDATPTFEDTDTNTEADSSGTSNNTDSNNGNESRYQNSDAGLTSGPQLALDNGNVDTRDGLTTVDTTQIPTPYRTFWSER